MNVQRIKSPPLPPFNRTAYGIEIRVWRWNIAVYSLLIAPLMELKLAARGFSSFSAQSFNRTAYGIEIDFPLLAKRTALAFNRTAYGIEMLTCKVD